MIVVLGGSDSDGRVLDSTELLSLPSSSSYLTCPRIDRYVSAQLQITAIIELT